MKTNITIEDIDADVASYIALLAQLFDDADEELDIENIRGTLQAVLDLSAQLAASNERLVQANQTYRLLYAVGRVFFCIWHDRWPEEALGLARDNLNALIDELEQKQEHRER